MIWPDNFMLPFYGPEKRDGYGCHNINVTIMGLIDIEEINSVTEHLHGSED